MNAAKQILFPLLEAKITGGMIGPRPRRELRRWEQRTGPHLHAGECARRRRQQKWIETKKAVAHQRPWLSPSGVAREINRYPHIYL